MKLNILSTIILFFLVVSSSVEAQTRRLPKKPEKNAKIETVSIVDNITGDILMGNIGFFNGLFLSTKANVGYKLIDRVAVGGGIKIFYNEVQISGRPNPKVFDYSPFLYSRIKVAGGFFIQGEYAFNSYGKDADRIFNLNRDPVLRTQVNSPLAGVGYLSGYGQWTFGLQVLYIFDEVARDIQGSIVEYWVGASYNF